MPRAPRRFRLVLPIFLGCALAVGVFLGRRELPTRESIRELRGEDTAPPKKMGEGAVPAPRIPPLLANAASSAPVFAPNALFAFTSPPNAAQLDAALPAPAHAIHYVRLNTALIAGKSSPFWKKSGEGRVELPLPAGGALRVVIDESTMLGADRFTSAGHLEGRPASRAVFAWNEGFLHASIDDAELGSFALRAATEAFAQFYQVDPALVAPCGGARQPIVDAATLAADVVRRARAAEPAPFGSPLPAPAATDNANPQRAEVHVMMAYTQSVLAATLGGSARTAALQSAFDAAIAKVNSDLAASAISARVKLVRLVETQYDEGAAASGTVQDTALTALYTTSDGKMDELHALRDQVGADLVCLALNRVDFASTGLAFVLDTPGDTLNGLFAFSVVQYSAIAGTSLVSHELGHNFGCAHDREHAQNAGAYSYSYGYRFTARDGRQYHDIMSYDPGTGLAFFSNPALTAPAPAPANSPGGIAPGAPGESDTSLTIEQNAFEVAAFRLQTQTAAGGGTLLNVSTRAYVGAGNQALIGGFVIAGTTPKKMLLRAAGPALANFTLATTVLVDPVLDLYAGPAVMQSNDNWSSGGAASAADLAAAATQVGAFPFANGSADAALLVTLPPGAYTALVRGAGGLTGFALIEGYEVGGAANKVINFGGRGYADNVGRALFAGFTVSGTPGATKRILIRVRGPSLTRDFGLAGGLDDPFMELRNAAGDLLLVNDDWSSGTVAGTASAVNDFNPLVRFYNEQRIVATGFAPANRRESCVLVDLPPGRYTVVVKPFELRDPDPAKDEPAKPGVALVEVFEINP